MDVALVTIYDHLASEDETIRLDAARRLLTKTFAENELNTVLRRLFRGLCSSRKAARLGFAVALTEVLSQLQDSEHKSAITPTKVIDLLEASTEAEGGSRGQEERDYYFGRVFGAGAIIQSGILFKDAERTQWKRLLNILCSVALKKPWLRQECGWTLCELAAGASDEAPLPFIEDIIDVLSTHKLVRTPEGVAIWLSAKKSFPSAKLSKHVWKYTHPLAAKDVSNLAEVMKNARTQQGDADFGAQGSTVWSASLHFAWLVVLSHFIRQESGSKEVNGSQKSNQTTELAGFPQFWQVVVDQGLFGTSSSTERKLWGVLLFSRVVATAPGSLVASTICQNTMHCLMSALNGEDRYLRKSAHSALQQLEQRLKAPEGMDLASGACLKALLTATDFIDFDTTTKSKVTTALLESGSRTEMRSVLQGLMQEVKATEDKAVSRKVKYLINLESRLLGSCIRPLTNDEARDKSLVSDILKSWLRGVSEESEDVRKHLKDRISAGLEQLIKAGSAGQRLFSAVLDIEDLSDSISDPAILDVMKKAAKRAKKLRKAIVKPQGMVNGRVTPVPTSRTTSLQEGLQLLYSLVAFDIYNGERESVEIMQDLLEITLPKDDTTGQSPDDLVEILLSFSSRPSKFLRTLTPIIFESIAPGLTKEGLRSLTRILMTKENAQGQQDMFEAADEEMFDGSDGSEDDSDEDDDEDEVMDSDVEIVNTADGSGSNSASNFDSESESEDGADDEKNDELEAFEAALASALGTSRADDGPESDSDADMDDEEMMALDEKLTEVFKARKQATSKKRDRKDAKENIINFKNRVLDLIEVYIKHQHLNPVVIELVLPLLQTTRTSQTKQVAERCNKALRDLCTRCKGQNVPLMASQGLEPDSEEVLHQIHAEACLEASNMHAAAASHASILLTKVLVKGGVPVDRAVQRYADTMTICLTQEGCHVQPSFFTDFNNWCTSARSWTVKQAPADAV